MRILWLKTELLHPVNIGGRIRTYNMLRELKRNHHITYLALDDASADESAREAAKEYCHELITVPHQKSSAKFSPGFYRELVVNLFSPLPHFVARYKSDEMTRAIVRYLEENATDVIICDFLMPSINLPPKVPCPVVLFQHNVEAMIWKRHYETQTNPLKKAYLYGQWRKSVSYEGAACRSVDAVIAVSTNDAEQMRNDYRIDAVWDVPTGVDIEYFSSSETVQRDSAALVFTGSMDWLPNDDGMRFFIEAIYPRIKRKIPNASLTVVGRNPLPSLFALSERDASIRITGRVEDVRPYMDQASVYIVPLRIGGGTRLKIFEAMAMAMPIVSTTIGAEGLPVRDEAELLLSDTPEEFSAAVVRLLEDEVLANRIGVNGYRLVREKYSWTRAAAIFADICERARTRGKAVPPIAENGTRTAVSTNDLEMSKRTEGALKG